MGALDAARERAWGYASQRGRYLLEGQAPSDLEAELVGHRGARRVTVRKTPDFHSSQLTGTLIIHRVGSREPVESVEIRVKRSPSGVRSAAWTALGPDPLEAG